jgi:RNA polymerase sigma-70 factor (ECF subfamily)
MTGSQSPARVSSSKGAAAIGRLAAAASRGDSHALSMLITDLQPQVYRWALVFTADPDEADDITQDAFVLMYRRLRQFSGEASFEGWMYRITRRVASQRGRTQRRRARLAGSSKARPEAEAYHTDPGARVDRERLRELVLEGVERLPPKQREVFDLVDLQGLTPSEAAELTGSNPATVRVHLFKARGAIRGRLAAADAKAREFIV